MGASLRAADISTVKRLMLMMAVASTLALLFSAQPPYRLDAFNDGDLDGIDDGVEATLAARFLPQIRYNSLEHCPLPLPARILFRARHPTYNGQTYTNMIAINYVRLYRNDCGPAGHVGDNEPFLVWIFWNGSDWQFSTVSATAHWGTVCEVKTEGYEPIVWAAQDKHGMFADLSQCDAGTFCNNHCTWNGSSMDYSLFNVGEPNAWLLNALGDVDNSFAGQTIWNDEQFFDAGKISDTLTLGGFYFSTRPPEYGPCLDACEAQYQSCIGGSLPQYCEDERNNCRASCDAFVHWDFNN